jgi:hypothetical protein
MKTIKIILLLALSVLGFPFWVLGILYKEFTLSFQVGANMLQKMYEEVLGD